MSYEKLEADLKNILEGQVRFDAGSRALYATDASNYRQVPIGVIYPKSEQDVIRAVSVCREHDVPILNRGAGTSLAGQCCNIAVILDMSKHLNRILSVDPDKKIARVEPGVILDDLQKKAMPYGLFFGPDPATHNRCTIGGMIGNNSCGVHSVTAGKTADNVEELEILTYDGLKFSVGKTPMPELEKKITEEGRKGEIYAGLKSLRDRYAELIRGRYPRIPRRVSGYNLDELLPENEFHIARSLTGTEGTCVTVLEATVRLIPYPVSRMLLVLGYGDVFSAADDVAKILEFKPIGIEGLDEHFVANMLKRGLHLKEIPLLPDGKSWLLVEFGAMAPDEALAQAQALIRYFEKTPGAPRMRLFETSREQKMIWSVRESTFGASVFVPGVKDTFAGFEDSAVPPAQLGDYMRDLQKLYEKYNYYAVTYGHFGDGCIHTRISFDLLEDEGIKKYRDFQGEAADLVIRYGGSLSGEHGDGQTWGDFLHKMFGPELVEAFREFKTIWDPANKMNPGKVVNAYRSDENLRLRSDKTIPAPPLYFKFPEEQGDFSKATRRCIGIGKCLKKDEGTMCPSYMVTNEEMHSTRGRAHLLFEMMRGEVIEQGWKDPHVKESLDLCLACKGCKNECPVGVDMASYKAEFLSHYYKNRPRPLQAYLFGWLPVWARIASQFPASSNGLLQAGWIHSLIKKWAGIAPGRKLPMIASKTFRQWHRGRAVRNAGKPKVLLWPDTFNNYFYPDTAQAACEVLEALGYQVVLPGKTLCCGRPLYDFGMLRTARGWLVNILNYLEPSLKEEIPLIALEPSCLAVFRDEMLNLLPNDQRAKKLNKNSYLLAEFIEVKTGLQTISRDAIAGRPGEGAGKVIMHGHCHQKALIGMDHEASLLSALGIDYEILDSGCCGMAGAFGFERQHYDMSLKIGNRVLLPRVNHAAPEDFVLADGFSCREQIAQATNRKALHLAEYLRSMLLGSSAPQ